MATVPRQKPNRSKQDYSTPEDFIAAVKHRLGIPAFVHDFAADASNAKAVSFFDEARDALSVPNWGDFCRAGWSWLNPPFNDIDPWAAKCREARDQGGSLAFLTPASVGANWFRDHVHGHALVLMLNGRLAFMPDKPTWLYPKDCVLSLYGPLVTPGYRVWSWRDDVLKKGFAA